MKTLKVSIATYEEMKARTMAIAGGEFRAKPAALNELANSSGRTPGYLSRSLRNSKDGSRWVRVKLPGGSAHFHFENSSTRLTSATRPGCPR